MINTLTMVLNTETKEVDIKLSTSLIIEDDGISVYMAFPYNEKVNKESSIFHIPVKIIQEEFKRLNSIYKNKKLSQKEKEKRINFKKEMFKRQLSENKKEFLRYLSLTTAEKIIENKNIGKDTSTKKKPRNI